VGVSACRCVAVCFCVGRACGLAVGVVLARPSHLGIPQRLLRAFTQWRSSWLSPRGFASVGCLLVLAPVALSDWLQLGWPRGLGLIGAALAVVTIFCTSMIYAQLKTIPRWNHWTTPALFMLFAGAGGAILAGQNGAGAVFSALLVAVLLTAFRIGDGAFAARAQTLGTATGLGIIGPIQGAVRVFEQPHTSPNYLMREMIYLVARKHVEKLRALALIGAGIGPALMLPLTPPTMMGFAVIALLHLIGAFAARWLFFAQAEHVVGLYYGQR